MNYDKFADIFNWILNFIAIGILVYAFAFVIPQEKKAFDECNTKVLCLQGYLKGSICDKYILLPVEINQSLLNRSFSDIEIGNKTYP